MIFLYKSTKIWLNYLVGGTISFLLLWNIYGQVMKQLAGAPGTAWQQVSPGWYLWLCIVLMFVNTSLEACKWYMLTRKVGPTTYRKAFCSYLAGIAFSIITPNRIGEYPGRILYLGRRHTFRYINVSILGVMAQLSAVYIFGFAGILYYNMAYPAGAGSHQGALYYYVPKVALALCGVANVLIGIVYWRFEAWLPLLGRIKWLRRFVIYGRLLGRATTASQIKILAISLARFTIFTAQFLFLLRCMNVGVPFAGGFCMAALFFWIMAVIPSIALTETGRTGHGGDFSLRAFFIKYGRYPGCNCRYLGAQSYYTFCYREHFNIKNEDITVRFLKSGSIKSH